MNDGETLSANDKVNGCASAKDQDKRTTAPEILPLDYDHVLLGLLDGASACMIERVVQFYPDLPGRPGMSEMEAFHRRVGSFDAS